MIPIQIRPYAASDREAVRDVCWHTASAGRSISSLYGDRESWVDMYTSYYTDREPECAWVAVAPDRRVVGYLLGCADTRTIRSEFQIAVSHNLRRFLWARPGTAGFWWRAGSDVVLDLVRGAKSPVDLARYPAHMHCNLLPEARGQGVAVRLFEQLHIALRARGVPGAHGQALSDNQALYRMLAKLGYRKHGEPYLIPGLRSPEGKRVYGQCVVCELDGVTALEAAASAPALRTPKGTPA